MSGDALIDCGDFDRFKQSLETPASRKTQYPMLLYIRSKNAGKMYRGETMSRAIRNALMGMVAVAAAIMPTASQSQQFYYRFKPEPLIPSVVGAPPQTPAPDPLVITLGAQDLPEGQVGTDWTYSFGPLATLSRGSASELSWSITGNLVPPGLVLSPTEGVLEGKPTERGAYDFEVVATHPDATTPGRRYYRIRIRDGQHLDVLKIYASIQFTCAITVDYAAKCWGYNDKGQLGDGTVTARRTPVDVVGLSSGVTHISVGLNSACAVHNGAAKCWGDNTNGQLGDGTRTGRRTPVQVSGLTSGVTSIEAGLSSHTCAIVNGGVKCWGLGSTGALGHGLLTDSLVPVEVLNLGAGSGVSDIAVGGSHSCAVQDGAAKCWGTNTSGQLGNGSTSRLTSPNQVSGLESGITSISAYDRHTCAIQNGGAKCWGVNTYGQIGINSTVNQLTPQTPIGLGAGVTSISAGSNHTCAVANGGAWCWGEGNYGRLGNGNNTNQSSPVSVLGLGGIPVSIDAGSQYTCAVMSNSGAKCWGINSYGILGDGTVTGSYSPVDVKAQ